MILKIFRKIKGFFLNNNVDKLDNYLLGQDLDKYISGIKNNILATFTLSVTLFLAGTITGTFNGFSFEPLNTPIREAAKILLGLPLYVEVSLRAIETEKPVIKRFFNRNKVVFGLFVIPFIVYIGTLYPFALSEIPLLFAYFLLSYLVAVFTYGAYILWVENLRDMSEKTPDFLDKLLYAALPASISAVIVMSLISYSLRIAIKTGVIG